MLPYRGIAVVCRCCAGSGAQMAAVLCWLAAAVLAAVAASYDDEYSSGKMPLYDYESPVLSPNEDYADRSPDTSSLDYKLEEDRTGKAEKVISKNNGDDEVWHEHAGTQHRQQAPVEDNLDSLDKHRSDNAKNKYKSRSPTPKIRPRIKNIESKADVSVVNKFGKTSNRNQNYENDDDPELDATEDFYTNKNDREYSSDVRRIEDADARYIRKDASLDQTTRRRPRNRTAKPRNERQLDYEENRKGNGRNIKSTAQIGDNRESPDYSEESGGRLRKHGHGHQNYENGEYQDSVAANPSISRSSLTTDRRVDEYGDYYVTKRSNIRINPSLHRRKQKAGPEAKSRASRSLDKEQPLPRTSVAASLDEDLDSTNELHSRTSIGFAQIDYIGPEPTVTQTISLIMTTRKVSQSDSLQTNTSRTEVYVSDRYMHSILKAQKKEGSRDRLLTNKPPILLLMATQNDSKSEDIKYRRFDSLSQSNETVEKARQIILQKIENNATIKEKLEKLGWDDLVCDTLSDTDIDPDHCRTPNIGANVYLTLSVLVTLCFLK